MDRVNSYGLNSPVESGDLNEIQDNALGIAQMAGHWITRPVLYAKGTTVGDVLVGQTAGLVIGTSTVLPAKGETALTGSLSANAWHYVYGYNDGGVIAYEVSTTAPDAYLRHKTGDISRTYVGCFRTRKLTDDVIPFRMERGEYRWRWSKGLDYSSYATTPTEMWWIAQTFTGSTSATNKTMEPAPGGVFMVPPHVRNVRMRGTSSGDSTSALDLGTGGDSGDRWVIFQPASTSAFVAWQDFELELDASQRLRYSVSDFADPGPGSMFAIIAFVGFRENLP